MFRATVCWLLCVCGGIMNEEKKQRKTNQEFNYLFDGLSHSSPHLSLSLPLPFSVLFNAFCLSSLALFVVCRSTFSILHMYFREL